MGYWVWEAAFTWVLALADITVHQNGRRERRTEEKGHREMGEELGRRGERSLVTYGTANDIGICRFVPSLAVE